MYEYLIPLIDKLKPKKILVIGDVGLDEYIIGNVTRISPEAPVPIFEGKRKHVKLGLAANVALNIKTFQGHCYLHTVLGEDKRKKQLFNLLPDGSVCYLEVGRKTTVKTRLIADQQLMRVDRESKHFIGEECEEMLIASVKEYGPWDCIIFQDYGKGVLSERLVKEVIQYSKVNNILTILDPTQKTNLSWYEGIDYLKCNLVEFDQLSKDYYLNEVVNNDIINTQGKDGVEIIGGQYKFPNFATEIVDVTGAGDTFVSILAIALSNRLSIKDSVLLANFASAISVGRFGCYAVTKDELKEFIYKYEA